MRTPYGTDSARSDFHQFWFLQNFDSDAGLVSMMDAKIVIIFRLKTLQ